MSKVNDIKTQNISSMGNGCRTQECNLLIDKVFQVPHLVFFGPILVDRSF